MSSKPNRFSLRDSVFVPASGAVAAGASLDDQAMSVTLVLRPCSARRSPDRYLGPLDRLPGKQMHLAHDAFKKCLGAAHGDMDTVVRLAGEAGLKVAAGSSATRRCVVLEGTCRQMNEFFGCRLVEFRHREGDHRGIDGAISIPAELRNIVQAVLGLHTRPVASPRARPARPSAPLSLTQLKAHYGFPRHLDGSGQTVAIIELGGGYRRTDLEEFMSRCGRAVPEVVDVGIEGTGNHPAQAKDLEALFALLDGRPKANLTAASTDDAALARAMATYETTMDLEVAAGAAPGARLAIYFAANDEAGLYHALTRAIHDEPRPAAITLSWTWPEPEEMGAEGNALSTYARLLDEVLQDAALLGVTVCVSSGDHGSGKGPSGKPCVEFPAGSPFVLACGGTQLTLAGDAITGESVWNSKYNGIWGASGGGVSRLFPQPAWQAGCDVPPAPVAPSGQGGRGVPDVAADASPESGVSIIVGGKAALSAGTSAAAPLWAALLACISQGLATRPGYITPLLYKLARQNPETFRPVVTGNNGAYSAGAGWDPCTGLGTPVGHQLLAALSGRAPAADTSLPSAGAEPASPPSDRS